MSRYTLTSNSMIFEFKWIEWNYINFRWFVVEPLIPISLSIVNCDHPVKHLLWMENKQRFYYQSRVHGFGMCWHETSQAKTGPRVNTFLQDKLHGAGLNLGVIILQHMERLPPKFNENSNSLRRRNLIFGQQYVVLWTEFLSCCGVSPHPYLPVPDELNQVSCFVLGCPWICLIFVLDIHSFRPCLFYNDQHLTGLQFKVYLDVSGAEISRRDSRLSPSCKGCSVPSCRQTDLPQRQHAQAPRLLANPGTSTSVEGRGFDSRTSWLSLPLLPLK